MTQTRLPSSTVAAVGDRARGYCERCGRWLPSAPFRSHHHRRPRAMGGTRDPLSRHPSNIVLICGSGTTGCHGWIETHREDALAVGWIVPQSTDGEPSDPREHPIWRPRIDSWMTPGPGRWFAMVERIDAHDRASILR